MEVSSEKSKILVNSAENTHASIEMNGEQLEEVEAFKYLGATITKDGKSITEIKTRIAIATSAMTKLDKIWKNNNISFYFFYVALMYHGTNERRNSDLL